MNNPCPLPSSSSLYIFGTCLLPHYIFRCTSASPDAIDRARRRQWHCLFLGECRISSPAYASLGNDDSNALHTTFQPTDREPSQYLPFSEGFDRTSENP